MRHSFEKNRDSFLANFLRKGALLIKLLVKPRSQNDDKKRREFILNVFLVGILFLSCMAMLLSAHGIYRSLIGSAPYRGFPLIGQFIITLIFLLLYFLSRKGHFEISAYILIFLYLLISIYFIWNWGVEIPTGLLNLVLVMIISGILISTKFANFLTAVIALIMVYFTYLELCGKSNSNLYWKSQPLKESDALIFIIMFGVINLFTWLSNSEIEKSLRRAKKSEAELKKERDLLEIKVDERTAELKRVQFEKLAQMSHFAEFGRLASGVLHDLINPLTAVSLNLEQIKKSNASDIKANIEDSIQATKRMENFIVSLKKQIQKQEVNKQFSPREEIIQVIQVLSYKARKDHVEIEFRPENKLSLFGNPLKFHQIVSNLIANSIDAYAHSERKERKILVEMTLESSIFKLKIEDWGAGIDRKYVDQIFDPFFTTKDSLSGTGIGLSIAKNIIEKDFQGTIEMASIEGEGTTFIIKLPIKVSESTQNKN